MDENSSLQDAYDNDAEFRAVIDGALASPVVRAGRRRPDRTRTLSDARGVLAGAGMDTTLVRPDDPDDPDDGRPAQLAGV